MLVPRVDFFRLHVGLSMDGIGANVGAELAQVPLPGLVITQDGDCLSAVRGGGDRGDIERYAVERYPRTILDCSSRALFIGCRQGGDDLVISFGRSNCCGSLSLVGAIEPQARMICQDAHALCMAIGRGNPEWSGAIGGRLIGVNP